MPSGNRVESNELRRGLKSGSWAVSTQCGTVLEGTLNRTSNLGQPLYSTFPHQIRSKIATQSSVFSSVLPTLCDTANARHTFSYTSKPAGYWMSNSDEILKHPMMGRPKRIDASKQINILRRVDREKQAEKQIKENYSQVSQFRTLHSRVVNAASPPPFPPPYSNPLAPSLSITTPSKGFIPNEVSGKIAAKAFTYYRNHRLRRSNSIEKIRTRSIIPDYPVSAFVKPVKSVSTETPDLLKDEDCLLIAVEILGKKMDVGPLPVTSTATYVTEKFSPEFDESSISSCISLTDNLNTIVVPSESSIVLCPFKSLIVELEHTSKFDPSLYSLNILGILTNYDINNAEMITASLCRFTTPFDLRYRYLRLKFSDHILHQSDFMSLLATRRSSFNGKIHESLTMTLKFSIDVVREPTPQKLNEFQYKTKTTQKGKDQKKHDQKRNIVKTATADNENNEMVLPHKVVVSKKTSKELFTSENNGENVFYRDSDSLVPESESYNHVSDVATTPPYKSLKLIVKKLEGVDFDTIGSSRARLIGCRIDYNESSVDFMAPAGSLATQSTAIVFPAEFKFPFDKEVKNLKINFLTTSKNSNETLRVAGSTQLDLKGLLATGDKSFGGPLPVSVTESPEAVSSAYVSVAFLPDQLTEASVKSKLSNVELPPSHIQALPLMVNLGVQEAIEKVESSRLISRFSKEIRMPRQLLIDGSEIATRSSEATHVAFVIEEIAQLEHISTDESLSIHVTSSVESKEVSLSIPSKLKLPKQLTGHLMLEVSDISTDHSQIGSGIINLSLLCQQFDKLVLQPQVAKRSQTLLVKIFNNDGFLTGHIVIHLLLVSSNASNLLINLRNNEETKPALRKQPSCNGARGFNTSPKQLQVHNAVELQKSGSHRLTSTNQAEVSMKILMTEEKQLSRSNISPIAASTQSFGEVVTLLPKRNTASEITTSTSPTINITREDSADPHVESGVFTVADTMPLTWSPVRLNAETPRPLKWSDSSPISRCSPLHSVHSPFVIYRPDLSPTNRSEASPMNQHYRDNFSPKNQHYRDNFSPNIRKDFYPVEGHSLFVGYHLTSEVKDEPENRYNQHISMQNTPDCYEKANAVGFLCSDVPDTVFSLKPTATVEAEVVARDAGFSIARKSSFEVHDNGGYDPFPTPLIPIPPQIERIEMIETFDVT